MQNRRIKLHGLRKILTLKISDLFAKPTSKVWLSWQREVEWPNAKAGKEILHKS